MIRVIVESPFAPRTQLPEDVCPYVGGYPGACIVNGPLGPDGYDACLKCKAGEQRRRESVLHRRYLAAALRDCVLRGETPYASHGLLTLPGVLRDDVPEERELGICAGFAWREAAHGTVFYTDLGWSGGMRAGEKHASDLKNEHLARFTRPTFHWIEERTLGGEWAALGLAAKYPR